MLRVFIINRSLLWISAHFCGHPDTRLSYLRREMKFENQITKSVRYHTPSALHIVRSAGSSFQSSEFVELESINNIESFSSLLRIIIRFMLTFSFHCTKTSLLKGQRWPRQDRQRRKNTNSCSTFNPFSFCTRRSFTEKHLSNLTKEIAGLRFPLYLEQLVRYQMRY